MILEALVKHYDRLESDPNSEVAPFGYSLQQVGFCVVLNPDGSLHAIEELTDPTQDKPRPIKLVLPGQSKPSGSGINPCLLWDNPTYMLGHVPEDREPDWATKRFEGFRDKHLALHDELKSDKGFAAICTFLEKWDPVSLEGRGDIEPLTRPGFGVFRLRGGEQFVHENEAVLQYWQSQIGEADAADDAASDAEAGIKPASGGTCLITGRRAPVARLHEPKIKNVSGAQSSGATLVSFNDNAYESFGLKQGAVAPVSERAAFQYTTALNALLSDREHRVQLGDTTVVFWTEKPADAPGGDHGDAPDPADALAEAFGVYREDKPGNDAAAEEGKARSSLQDFLNRYRQGKADPAADNLEQAETRFHVLGLSPNAARISVRFWMSCSVRELAGRLDARSNALQIVGLDSDQTPTTWQIIRSTARDSKEIKHNLAGDYTRSFLNKRPIPNSFAHAVLSRIRIDGEVSAVRAAGLKGYLITNGIEKMDIYLNREHPSIAYHCGRILAVLGFAQSQALGEINAGVVKKNFASAMATPGLTLGRLQRAAAVGHIGKLSESMAEFVNDELAQANCRLKDGPPKNLGPDQQTLFALGFYQQSAYLRSVQSRVSKRHPNRSNMGEWMRSKLEVKVANAMNRADIEYIYEPSLILESAGPGEKFPDFVIRGGGDASNDVYIEVAGYPGEEYQARHEKKVNAYHDQQITLSGGEKGRLIVLDYRERDYDDASVYDALRFMLPEPPDNNSPNPSEES